MSNDENTQVADSSPAIRTIIPKDIHRDCLCLTSPAVLDLLRARAEDRLDDALRKRFVRSEADRAGRGIVSIEHVAQRAQRRTAPDEQCGMTLGRPETRQRMTVQFEEGHAVTNVLHGLGVELLDLLSEL